MMEINFNGKVVIVTGAVGALGSAVSQAFRQAGAKVAYVDRANERMERVAAEVAQDPEHNLVVCADLMTLEGAEQMATEVSDYFGSIDVLINTVGGFRSGKPLHETPKETWDLMMDLNARTVYNTCKAVIPHMLRSRSGAIVSVAARPGLTGKENMAAYSVSKAAVLRLTESMAAELRVADIRVNCVIPGTIDTSANREDMPDADTSRWVKPDSLAGVILFLSSDLARDITGAAVPVYGRS
jgi:NAD(P)-dependent dehydrogenase (short-subunit alcohol dehydrogenase family)